MSVRRVSIPFVKVSVIVPVFKAEDFLSKCLDSLSRQTFGDFEVICVDDGSPDNSADIILRHADFDSRFSLVRQENGGAAAARNAGFQLSSGTYVTYVDADDEVSERFLEVLVEAAEADSSDVVVANKTIINQRGTSRTKTPKLRRGYSDGLDMERHRSLLRHIAPHGKLIRREYLTHHDIHFYEGVTYEDYIFWFDVLSRNPRTSLLPDIIYTYKRNEGSISSGSKRLNSFQIESRIVQTRECIRIAEESGNEAFRDHVTQVQLGNSVIRHLKAMAVIDDHDLIQQAAQSLRKGLAPYRKTINRILGGWRRLAYTLLFDGELDDLVKFMRYVDGKRSLSTHMVRKSNKHDIYISRNELISLKSHKTHIFNVSDLVRK